MKLGDLVSEMRSTYSVKEDKNGDIVTVEFEASELAESGYTWFDDGHSTKVRRYRKDNVQIKGQIIKFQDILICVRGAHCGKIGIMNLQKGMNYIPTPAAFVILRCSKPLRAIYAYQSLLESSIEDYIKIDQRGVKCLSQEAIANLEIPDITNERAKWAYLKLSLADEFTSIRNEWSDMEFDANFGDYSSLLKNLAGMEARIRKLMQDVRSVRDTRKPKKPWQEI